jgi:hypothetical protein
MEVVCPTCGQPIMIPEAANSFAPPVASKERQGQTAELSAPANRAEMIVVARAAYPAKGHYIADQRCTFFSSDQGLQGILVKWESVSFFSRATWLGPSEKWFGFTRDASLVAELTQKQAKSVSRAAGIAQGKQVPFSLSTLLALTTAFVGAATAKAHDIKAISVLYRNEERSLAMFSAVSSPEAISEILASMPANAIASNEEQLWAEWRKHCKE